MSFHAPGTCSFFISYLGGFPTDGMRSMWVLPWEWPPREREGGVVQWVHWPYFTMGWVESEMGRQHTDQIQAIKTQTWWGAGSVGLMVWQNGWESCSQVGRLRGTNMRNSLWRSFETIARHCTVPCSNKTAGTVMKPIILVVSGSWSLPVTSPSLLQRASPYFCPHPEQSLRRDPSKASRSFTGMGSNPHVPITFAPRLGCRHPAPNHDALATWYGGGQGTKTKFGCFCLWHKVRLNHPTLYSRHIPCLEWGFWLQNISV